MAKKSVLPELSADTLWQEVDSVLIVMTSHTNGSPDALFKRLHERFPDARLLALRLPGAPISVSEEIYTSGYVKFSPLVREDIGLFGKLSPLVQERLNVLRPQLAIDLSQTFEPLSAYLCQISGARIKVGFALPEHDLVFNYQIAPVVQSSPDDCYHALARYIG